MRLTAQLGQKDRPSVVSSLSGGRRPWMAPTLAGAVAVAAIGFSLWTWRGEVVGLIGWTEGASLGSLLGLRGPMVAMPMPPRSGPERNPLIAPPATPRTVAPDRPPRPEGPVDRPPRPEGAPQPPAAASATPPPALVTPPPRKVVTVPERPSPPAQPSPPPSYATLPERPDKPEALPPAPLPDLLRKGPHGTLPVVSREGGTSWQMYGRPFTGDRNAPKAAAVVTGLGLDKVATQAAIDRLPGVVSLAFSPYAHDLDGWIKKARAAGHEVLLALPMQPRDFPASDPGPDALLAGLDPGTAVQRLETVLGRTAGYVGVVAPPGSPFIDGPAMATVLSALRDRGLLYVGDGAARSRGPSVPVFAVADEQGFGEAIDARLAQLADAATRDGTATALLSPSPLSYDRLLRWLAQAPKAGITPAPVSAVAKSLGPQ